MNHRKRLLCETVALSGLVCACAFAQQAQEQSADSAAVKVYTVTQLDKPQKADTLVGRPDKIQVIKNGAATEVNKQDLPLLNRYTPAQRLQAAPTPAEDVEKKNAENSETSKLSPGSAPSQEQGKGADAKAESGEQAGSPPPGKRGAPAQGAKEVTLDPKQAKAKAAEEKAAKERAEAIKKANIERLRELEYQSAWFYDKKGQPISSDELNRRIEKGDLDDIQATDIYLRTWKMEPSKADGQSQGKNATSGASAQGK